MNWQQAFDENYWNISNLLSIVRVLLLPFFIYLTLLYVENATGALLSYIISIAILATATDFLDGFLARLLHQETIIGRYLDPICDKIVILSAMTLLLLYFELPVWVYSFYIGREIVGVWGGTFLYFKRNLQARPNIFGKIAVAMAALLTLWYYSVPYLKTVLSADDFFLDASPAAYLFVLIHVLGMIGYLQSYGKIIVAKN
ncbi:MAG: CDP-alcohol phosphatidyltransferase family protein [Leptonema sp. (in: Bacteria)]|nr:CDP-alcohol phosphatidyltransferase family protein [Leptonema sp. (in: bacteria)]